MWSVQDVIKKCPWDQHLWKGGREQDAEEKRAVMESLKPQPTLRGSSGVKMSSPSCPTLGQDGWAFIFPHHWVRASVAGQGLGGQGRSVAEPLCLMQLTARQQLGQVLSFFQILFIYLTESV